MAREKLPDVRKIAVLKANALGDFLSTTPALRALRTAYPDAEIVFLGRPLHKLLIESRPGPVNRAVVIPLCRGVREEPGMDPDVENSQELDEFFAAMQQEKFDVAIQMHGGGKFSNPFVKRLGARFTVGMRTPDAPELDLWMPYVVYQHEFMRPLELVGLIGAEPCGFHLEFAVTDGDRAELRRQIPVLGGPYAVLHPGAADPRRRWPAERFARVGDALATNGLSVVITGVDYERDDVSQVIEQMSYPAVNACEKLSIGGLAALLEGAEVLVSNDTGPLHIAEAVGTPNAGIYWVGNAINWAHFGRSAHRALMSWTLYCPLCGADMSVIDPSRDRCQHDTCFVDRVTVDEVIGAALELVAYKRRFGKVRQA